MKLRQIETPGISHYAYLLADEGGDAFLVDPRRDVDEYLSVARSMGVRIRYIVETHRQEDCVMGSTHLAQLTGARSASTPGQRRKFVVTCGVRNRAGIAVSCVRDSLHGRADS